MANISSGDGYSNLSWDDVKEKITDAVLATKEVSGLTILKDDSAVEDDRPAVDVVRLGKLLVATLLSAIVVGVNVIQEAIFSVLASPFEAVGSFGADLVETLFGLPSGLIKTAAETTAEGASAFGVLAWIIGVGGILAGLYAVAFAVQEGL